MFNDVLVIIGLLLGWRAQRKVVNYNTTYYYDFDEFMKDKE